MKLVGIHGHQIEKEYNISFTNRWSNRGGEHPYGSDIHMVVIHLLRGYCSKKLKLWDEHFHYIQRAYNWAKHSSTQTSAFEACL